MAKRREVKADKIGPAGTAGDLVVIGRDGKATVEEPGAALVQFDDEQPRTGGKV